MKARYEIALADSEHIDGKAWRTHYYGTRKQAIAHAWNWFNKVLAAGAPVFLPMIGEQQFNDLDEPIGIDWKYLG